MCATYKKNVKPNNKLEREICEFKNRKASDELNLKIKKPTNKLNNNLIDLDIIFEKIEGVNDNKRLGKKRLKHSLKKELEKFIANEREELEYKIALLKLKSRICNYQSDDEEKMKEKIIIEDSNNIKRFKAKLKKIYKKKKNETDNNSFRLVSDLSEEKYSI